MSRSVRRGFSLLEALVALTIVGLAAVGTLRAYGGEIRSAERARWTLTAAALAEEQLSRLRLTPRSTLDFSPDSLRKGAFARPFDRFTWTASVTRVQSQRDLFDINVQVSEGDVILRRMARVYRPQRLTVPQ
ncbi:MAG: type IV pilus modification PilV family protein [Gemmatimonadaceae bacterium]